MNRWLYIAALVGAGIIFGAGYSWSKPYPYELTCVGELLGDGGSTINGLDRLWYLDADDDMCGARVEKEDLKKRLLAECDLESYCKIAGRVEQHRVDVYGTEITYYEWIDIKGITRLAK